MNEYLSNEDISKLPEGTPLIVWWEGGNGPGRYTVTYDKWGYAWFRSWRGDLILKDPVDSILCSGLKAIRMPKLYQMIPPFNFDYKVTS